MRKTALSQVLDAQKHYALSLKELGLDPSDVIYKPVDLFEFLNLVKKKLHMTKEAHA